MADTSQRDVTQRNDRSVEVERRLRELLDRSERQLLELEYVKGYLLALLIGRAKDAWALRPEHASIGSS